MTSGVSVASSAGPSFITIRRQKTQLEHFNSQLLQEDRNKWSFINGAPHCPTVSLTHVPCVQGFLLHTILTEKYISDVLASGVEGGHPEEPGNTKIGTL